MREVWDKGKELKQDVDTMKVEVNLTLVKGQDETCTSPRKPPKASREVSSPGIKLLISKENQQARRLDPASLTETIYLPIFTKPLILNEN